MTRPPDIPKVYRRRRTNLLLSPDAVDSIRSHVLPLLPGVSLSDLVDSFLQGFASSIVPVIVSLNDLPEEVRADAAESAMAELLGRFIMGSVRTNPPLFPPPEVKSG